MTQCHILALEKVEEAWSAMQAMHMLYSANLPYQEDVESR